MAEIEKVEYEFPHEKEEKEAKQSQKELPLDEKRAAEPEIEVVDDTTPQDRNRKLLDSPPEDPTDDELETYSEEVRKRLQHFTKGYHEERRAKEAALREREEALRIAQAIIEENKKLKGSLGRGQEALINQAKNAVGLELEKAKQKYKEAYEAGDTDKLVEAQDELTSIKIKADRINNFKPPLQEPETPVEPRLNVQAPQADTKALAWQKANPWFGSNRRMTAVAMEVHNELVRSGVSPTSDTYYAQINAEVRKVFPDAFPSEKPSRSKNGVVAPATRSTAPKKIVLTQTQVTLAKRLGLTPEQYARAAADVMRNQND